MREGREGRGREREGEGEGEGERGRGRGREREKPTQQALLCCSVITTLIVFVA